MFSVDEVFNNLGTVGQAERGYWAVSDHAGTIHELIESDADSSSTNNHNLVQHLDYDASGRIARAINGSGTPLSSLQQLATDVAFAGRDWDNDASLYYNRARWYDANTGRFISEDPIGFSAGDANLYRYANNDPVNFRDPSGQIIGALISIGVSLAGQYLDREINGNEGTTSFGFTIGVDSGGVVAFEGVADIGGVPTGIPLGTARLPLGTRQLAVDHYSVEPDPFQPGFNVYRATKFGLGGLPANRLEEILRKHENGEELTNGEIEEAKAIFLLDPWQVQELRDEIISVDPVIRATAAGIYPMQRDPGGLGTKELHLALDLFGFIPGGGNVADGINGLVYLAEGEYKQAAIQGVTLIPFGNFLRGAKYFKFADEGEELAEVGVRSADLSITHKSGTLTYDVASRAWLSPRGVTYGQGSIQGNRVLHVMEHLTPNSAKSVHSVFNVQRSELIGLIDDAWIGRGASVPGDPGAFVIPMGRTIGTAGETSIKIIVKPGTSEIITAFPVK